MILVECYSDELLLRILEIPSEQIRHEMAGKGKIINRLEREQASLGIIDEDPGKTQPRKLQNYQVIEDHQIFDILAHRDLPNVNLIRLKPDLEQWILDRAVEAEIDITMYGYPNNAVELHGRGRIDREQRFINFLNQLRSNNQSFDLLRNRIHALLWSRN